jgi:hypothetical protein
MIVVNRNRQLPQVVLALSPASGLTSLLHCWQKQRHQNGNDRNHHQQFNLRKSTTTHPPVSAFKQA